MMNKRFVCGLAVGIGICSIIGAVVVNNINKKFKKILNERLIANCHFGYYNSVKWLLENGADIKNDQIRIKACDTDHAEIGYLLSHAIHGKELPSEKDTDKVFAKITEFRKNEKNINE